jgi:alkanesulfonate monooxygenase SsuD/methylene tetrahydromethanopterin reductase-like flavin-dependent oxidoreductase (luciferase family)
MKLGVLVEVEEGLDWDGWRATYTAAERSGFDSVWLSDHLQSPWSEARHGLETWTALAVAAAETHQVVLGPLVSPVTFREPAIVARMAEALGALAPGRFVVGLGLGWNADEHAAASIAFPVAAERARRLTETIAHIRCEVAERRVPLLIGGSGARLTLPLVARFADEWNVTTGSAVEFRRMSEQIDALCREIGRDPCEIRRSAATGVLVGRDTRDLVQRATRMRGCVPPLNQVDDVLDEARRMGWFVGTPETLIAELQAFKDAGADRVILGHYDVTNVGTLEVLADAVLPALA